MVFANHSKEDVIYTLTVKEIALTQEEDSVLKKLSKTDKYSTHLVSSQGLLSDREHHAHLNWRFAKIPCSNSPADLQHPIPPHVA